MSINSVLVKLIDFSFKRSLKRRPVIYELDRRESLLIAREIFIKAKEEIPVEEFYNKFKESGINICSKGALWVLQSIQLEYFYYTMYGEYLSTPTAEEQQKKAIKEKITGEIWVGLSQQSLLDFLYKGE